MEFDMKRLTVVSLLVFAALSLVIGQTRLKSPTQNEVEEQIKLLEREWLVESYRASSMAAFDRIVADSFTIAHTNGSVLNKAEKRADIIASHVSDPKSPSYFFIEKANVTLYGDTAVSVGSIAEKDNHVRFTNTYVKRNGQWQVVASQLTRIRQQ